MTLLKKSNIESSTVVRWPNQLITPTELIKSLRNKSQFRLVRSPICSKIVLQVVGSWSYILAHVLNRSRVYNLDTFQQEIKQVENVNQLDAEQCCDLSQSNRAPLLTISNHISCIDDPILWASLLPFTYYSRKTDSVRWSPAAKEICFSKPWHSTFFALGKTFPILRGVGLEQPAMEFANALLQCNQWLHLFPEGRVMRDSNQQVIDNKERGYLFKWGVSKLIMDFLMKDPQENDRTLRLLPFYHLGLDEILPIGWPYLPRLGKQITIYVRPTVIEMNVKLLRDIFASRTLASPETRSVEENNRIKLTNYLEEEVENLSGLTKKLHYGE